MYLAYDKDKVIRAISNTPFKTQGQTVVYVDKEIKKSDWTHYIGKTVTASKTPKPVSELRIAMICNWKDRCGISTYSDFLVQELRTKVLNLHIYSEINGNDPEDNVTYCWVRGHSMIETINKVMEWNPDFIIIQHEYGLFPNAFHYMKMMELLKDTPHLVVMHSVYEHLDKMICSGVTKHIAVHSNDAKDVLVRLGNTSNIYVIPHGCVNYDSVEELWNIFKNPYTLMQFGFGFYYKGMDRAIDAINYLKQKDSKFKDIYYCCLISTNGHNSNIHDDYYKFLIKKIEDLELQNNVTIHIGFFSNEVLNCFLRTAKIALFPYKIDSNNTVYGASGAIRIAMANNIPVIASESHLFDDLQDVVARPKDCVELAKEIDEIFSNENYRKDLQEKQKKFIKTNNWKSVSYKYIELYYSIHEKMYNNHVELCE